MNHSGEQASVAQLRLAAGCSCGSHRSSLTASKVLVLAQLTFLV
jgi:hypothetical protein